MADTLQIHFITWPDGKLFEGSQTSINEDTAIAQALQTWLIPDFFPGVDLGRRYGGGAMRYLWEAMERAGFKVHSLDVPDDIAKGVSR
jgi:hypothetical protein